MSLTVNWVSQKPTFNTTGSNQSPNFALDNQSNIYVVYDTDSVASGQTSTGLRDIVVFKLDQFGVTQWVQQQPTFNTSGLDMNPVIAIDNLNNIYVAYQTTGTVSGQTHEGVGTDIVVFKMDYVYGTVQWAVQQATFNTSFSDMAPSIVVDTQGYIYVGYHTQGGNITSQTATGAFDIVIFKLEPLTGGCVWAIQQPAFNGPISNTYVHLAMSPSGYIYCSYQIIGAASGQVYSGGLSDIVVFKIEPTHGTCLWISQTPSFNTKGTDVSCSIAVDSLDYIYVCYQSNKAVSGQTNVGQNDIVVFKLEPSSGLCVWVTEQPSFNTTSDDVVPCVAIDPEDYIYICYDTAGTASGQTNTGEHDIVIFKMEPTQGQCMWVNQLPIFNTDQDDLNPKMIADQSGTLYLTYQTNGTPASGGQTLTGSSDIIVYNLSPPYPHIRFLQYYGQFEVSPPIIGTPVKYTFEVENYGGLPIYDVKFNDNLDPTAYSIGALVPGQKKNVTGITRHLVTQEDFDFGLIYTQATIDGHYYSSVTSDYSEYKLTVPQTISMLVTKQAVAVDKYIGGFITYEIAAKNTGNIPFANLFLTDPKLGIYDQLLIDVLQPGHTFTDTEYLLITEEIWKEWTIKNVAYISATDSKGKKHTFSAEDITTLCLMRDSMIQMMDGTSKPIQDIKRGEVVAPGHTVARLCEIKLESHILTELVEFTPNSLGNNLPNAKLIMTSNHPILFVNARRPAHCFTHLKGITVNKVRGIEILYDLQFDHDGTYIANGIEVQSCSPRSAYNPLPRDLYFDVSLYSDELVWDAYEQQIELVSEQVTPRILNPSHTKRKNHLQRIEHYRQKKEGNKNS